MSITTVRYVMFPSTEPPPSFVSQIASVFQHNEIQIGTQNIKKGFTSDEVLGYLRPDLLSLGFQVEMGKTKLDKIDRPVFFGENGIPTHRYQIDAYHPTWNCGLEVEAGRAVMGNAIYRDIVQALVMVDVDYLVLAVPNIYKYMSSGRPTSSNDFEFTVKLARTLYSHSRFKFPYNLIVIGY